MDKEVGTMASEGSKSDQWRVVGRDGRSVKFSPSVKNPGRSDDQSREIADSKHGQYNDQLERRGKDNSNSKRNYKKENTVEVSIQEGDKVDVMDILDEIEHMCGVGSILGCVQNARNVFDVTLADKSCKNVLKAGFRIKDRYDASVRPLFEDSLIVSVMHMPIHIPDRILTEKLEKYNVRVISPIYRKYYEGREYEIETGTRYCRVRFPEGFSSLPYAIKFDNIGNHKYYKVLHNGQIKVCNQCLSPDHEIKNCPETKCFSCSGKGHIARDCKGNYNGTKKTNTENQANAVNPMKKTLDKMKELSQRPLGKDIDWWDVGTTDMQEQNEEKADNSRNQVTHKAHESEEATDDTISDEEKDENVSSSEEEETGASEEEKEDDDEIEDEALDLTQKRVDEEGQEICFGDFELGVVSGKTQNITDRSDRQNEHAGPQKEKNEKTQDIDIRKEIKQNIKDNKQQKDKQIEKGADDYKDTKNVKDKKPQEKKMSTRDRNEENEDEDMDTTESKGRRKRTQPDSEDTDEKTKKNSGDPKRKTKKKTA